MSIPQVSTGGALPTVPWARREPGGIYVANDNRSTWVYRELALAPLEYEDPNRRLEVGDNLHELLVEIGSRARDVAEGLSLLSQNRSIHIFSAVFETVAEPPKGTPKQLELLIDSLLPNLVRNKTLLVGVKLRSSFLAQATKSRGSLKDRAKALFQASTEDTSLGLDSFAADLADLETTFRRLHARVPQEESLRQLEAWWNYGQTPDVVNEFAPDEFHVAGGQTYEIRAVQELPNQLSAPYAQWLLDAISHASGVKAVSIRADLEPPTVTRTRLRRQRRKLIDREEQEQATGDLGRDEETATLHYAKDVESFVVNTREPWATNVSILLARAVDGADETYADMLRNVYQIKTEPLPHRQLEALSEMQPASPVRINPFSQETSLSYLSYAGLAGFSNLGDANGVFAGNINPDHVPSYIDPFASAKQNLPPVMGVFGDPGSGKTFFAQLVAAQAALAGMNVFFVNPKGFDSLNPWVEYVQDLGVPARTVSFSKIEQKGGAFDPFTFCTNPHMAAEILTRHIQSCLADALTPRESFAVGADLAKAADAGVGCGFDALEYIREESVRELILGAISSNTLFALAFARVPHDDWANTSGLTLIEFDRELPLPTEFTKNIGPAERMAQAALRLTSRAAMEILMRHNGGVYVIDEAHHYIASDEGMASLDRLAREGRSMGLLPIFITQQPSDLLSVDMDSYMSRVMAMKLGKEEEAAAALRLCGLKPTRPRIDFLRSCGPQPKSEDTPGRPASGLMRDVYDRHSVVLVGPVPEEMRMAMSTNRSDREKRDAEAEARAAHKPEEGL